MFRLLAVLASLFTVNSFSLSTSRNVRSVLKMGFEKEIGVQAPLGFWDPLGLLKNADQERFDSLRKYEVKHGRVAMVKV